jgi:hypothetical protein
MKKIFLLFFAAFLFSNGLIAQEIWESVDKSVNDFQINSEVLHPDNSKFYSLDATRLLTELKSVYSREELSVLESNVLVSFPNLDGQLESYRIIEASVMTPELQEQFPNIRSYAGQSVDNPTDVIRFSISPEAGLSGMIRSIGRGTYYIEPESLDDNIYAVYDKSVADNSSFACSTEETQAEFESQLELYDRAANDGLLHTFRLALSCTGEYGAWAGGTEAGVMAKFNATMTRVNGVFEIDFSATMVMIANEIDIIYFNGSTDPYSSPSNYNSELQNNLTSVIGEANYDIGHLVGKGGSGGNAGCIGCICVNGQKGRGYTSTSVPQGDNFDIDFVAHEMGHQFGCNHTFTHGYEGTIAQVEPGSGSTIMGYAGVAGAYNVQSHSDDYFSFISIQQATTHISSRTCDTETSLTQATPTVDAGVDYKIPKTTPFVLTGVGTSDGTTTFCWEENDLGNPSHTYPSTTGTSGPSFRSFDPTEKPERYFPRYITLLSGALGWKWEKLNDVSRIYKFKLTVRDNIAGGGQNVVDDMRVTVDANAGPFQVTSQTAYESWNSGTSHTITWDVANTDAATINTPSVDIYIIYSGGNEIVEVITDVPNNGSYTITIPHGFSTTNARVMVKGHNNVFFSINTKNLTIVNMGAGVDENYVDSKIKLFPNPTDGLLEIDNKEFVNLIIFDVLGQELATKSFEIGNNQIDMSQYKSGVYFVQATLADNVSKTYRIVKK